MEGGMENAAGHVKEGMDNAARHVKEGMKNAAGSYGKHMEQGMGTAAELHGKLVARGMVQAAKELGKAAGVIAAVHFFLNSFVSRMGALPVACCSPMPAMAPRTNLTSSFKAP
jgi:hypothetical protein